MSCTHANDIGATTLSKSVSYIPSAAKRARYALMAFVMRLSTGFSDAPTAAAIFAVVPCTSHPSIGRAGSLDSRREAVRDLLSHHFPVGE